eukprot:362471-Chlamydomonas_euryale.AAC.7
MLPVECELGRGRSRAPCTTTAHCHHDMLLIHSHTDVQPGRPLWRDAHSSPMWGCAHSSPCIWPVSFASTSASCSRTSCCAVLSPPSPAASFSSISRSTCRSLLDRPASDFGGGSSSGAPFCTAMGRRPMGQQQNQLAPDQLAQRWGDGQGQRWRQV